MSHSEPALNEIPANPLVPIFTEYRKSNEVALSELLVGRELSPYREPPIPILAIIPTPTLSYPIVPLLIYFSIVAILEPRIVGAPKFTRKNIIHFIRRIEGIYK